MTKEEKLKILLDAEERAYRAIAETEGKDMRTQEFRTLLQSAAELSYRAKTTAEAIGTAGALAQTAPVSPTAPAEAPETEAPKATAPTVTITKDEMKTRLSELGDKCSDDSVIPGAMKSMGYTKLSQIPAERYAELLEKVETAVKGAA